MLKKYILLGFLFVCFSCAREDGREQEIARIHVDVEIKRFDQRFARTTADSLPELKQDFPYLFPRQYDDSVWIEKMNDTIQQEINEEVSKTFPDLSQTRTELHDLFQHIKYYFPQAEIPTVVTLTSEVDYRNKVVWAGDLLLISLDTYLGPDHHFYVGIQSYLKKNFEREQIVPDAAAAFAEKVVERPQGRDFLAHMIYYGKMLYLQDLLIPFKKDFRKIGYTPEELDWAQDNEEQIWRYFIDREILYESDSELQSRFLYPGPFTKFNLEIDQHAPAKLGQYIGWQIVRQFMEKNEVSVHEMLETDAETMFNKSNFKPRKS